MTTTDPIPRKPPSILGPVSGLCGTLALLAWIGLGDRLEAPPSPPAIAPPPPIVAIAKVPAPVIVPVVQPEPKPLPPPKLEPDRAAIARAEASLEATTRERAETEARLGDAALELRKAAIEAAGAASSSRMLAFQVKDPSARIERATNQIATARWEVKKLQNEISALDKIPRTKARALMDKSAVAKPIDGKEYHFEVRRDRIAYVDIDKFTEMIKNEVKLRLRMSGPRGRALTGAVGPVGDFSMRYEMGLSMPDSMSELLDMREISLQLRGWEIVPESDLRGETFEKVASPGSAYSRIINRISPTSATITLWIYPDGYALYRRLRDDLHAKGFLVAARPLPDGMTIRGSPGGSLSAGQ